MSNKKQKSPESPSLVDSEQQEQDQADIEVVKEQLKKELRVIPNTPTFNLGADGKSDHTFTKEFMKQLTYICNKYQLIASTLIKNQSQQRRYTALEANNDEAYEKAFREKDARSLKLATEIEDTVFDYFGIIQLQWEASNRKLKDDPVYMAEKSQMQEELTKEFATDLDPDMNDQEGL